jgi:tubulin--tyrosine ligase-like protein 12
MDLMAIKPLPTESDVFLIDHAWTFSYQDAFDTLIKNPSLVTRLENSTEYACKKDLPEAPKAEESKLDANAAFEKCLANGGRVFDLDNLGIEGIQQFAWPETAEEISLFGNEIINPNDIATKLVDLPCLKALWLNGNPVAYSCSNFESIGELFPQLEILNSRLTHKAGEWAMLFYARSQGGKTLDQIESLNLSGKGVTMLHDASIFKQMVNLRRLDLTEHPEFFMCEEKKEALEYQALHGINPD